MAEYRIRKKHFEVFKAEVEKWVDLFGLQEWELTISSKKLSDSLAQCNYNTEARCATISIAIIWDRKITNYEIKDAAQHEVLELLLAELSTFYNVAYPDHLIDITRHSVIQKILNSIRKGKLKTK